MRRRFMRLFDVALIRGLADSFIRRLSGTLIDAYVDSVADSRMGVMPDSMIDSFSGALPERRAGSSKRWRIRPLIDYPPSVRNPPINQRINVSANK